MSLAKLAAQIRYERKQAQHFALLNAKFEDSDAEFLGFAHRDIVELCDRKIEHLQFILDMLRACRCKKSPSS